MAISSVDGQPDRASPRPDPGRSLLLGAWLWGQSFVLPDTGGAGSVSPRSRGTSRRLGLDLRVIQRVPAHQVPRSTLPRNSIFRVRNRCICKHLHFALSAMHSRRFLSLRRGAARSPLLGMTIGRAPPVGWQTASVDARKKQPVFPSVERGTWAGGDALDELQERTGRIACPPRFSDVSRCIRCPSPPHPAPAGLQPHHPRPPPMFLS